ncbi:hypothetical protein MesoLjLb_76420 [Mesorhizobium sp. L-8-3]|nr:hypothetical protein MesoLjLb_76420 [Mesorhizobium sp. L-8-3]
MATITNAHAYANNEVAYVAWEIDEKIPGCLGFEVIRVYLNPDGSVAKRRDGSDDRVSCAAWVGFKGQRNPHWLPHVSGMWPIQKLSWRDLTLRKKRDGLRRRPDDVRVRYEIRAVGDLGPGMEPAPDPTPYKARVAKKDETGRPVHDANGDPVMVEVASYTGTPRPLGYLGPVVATNDVHVTTRRGVFRSTFTNGVLAAQWLRNVLLEGDGVIEPNELIDKISDPNDPHRKYLAGDVLPLLRELFSRPGEFYLGLYELEDRELIDLLLTNSDRIHVILANTGAEGKVWDRRNAEARQALIDAGVDIQHRMFNNSTHIGHNKFVVHVPTGGVPAAVFTGSTNWTQTGIAGQTNNALLIEEPTVATVFFDYWTRMRDDALVVPDPFGAEMKDAQQSGAFRQSNYTKSTVPLGNGAELTVWFSPNTPQRKKTKKLPPDLSDIYGRMRRAERAILFLAFYPGQSGNDCIIGEAIDIGRKDRNLIVMGAVSSAQAMPTYPRRRTTPTILTTIRLANHHIRSRKPMWRS